MISDRSLNIVFSEQTSTLITAMFNIVFAKRLCLTSSLEGQGIYIYMCVFELYFLDAMQIKYTSILIPFSFFKIMWCYFLYTCLLYVCSIDRAQDSKWNNAARPACWKSWAPWIIPYRMRSRWSARSWRTRSDLRLQSYRKTHKPISYNII